MRLTESNPNFFAAAMSQVYSDTSKAELIVRNIRLGCVAEGKEAILMCFYFPWIGELSHKYVTE